MVARITGIVYLLYFATAIVARLLQSHNFLALGKALGLLSVCWYVALTLLFYMLFRFVNPGLSLVAALFSGAGCVLMTLGTVRPGLHVVNPLVLFGVFDIAIGVLIWKSAFIPKWLGGLMVLAGTGWLAARFPPLSTDIGTPSMVIGFVAELALMLWLLLRNVDERRRDAGTRRSHSATSSGRCASAIGTAAEIDLPHAFIVPFTSSHGPK